VPQEGGVEADMVTDQDRVLVTDRVAVEDAVALGVEEVVAVEEGEGVVEGEGVPLPLPVPLAVVVGEEEEEEEEVALRDAPALPLAAAPTVGAGLSVPTLTRVCTPLGEGEEFPEADPEAVALAEVLGWGLALVECVAEGEALALADPEGEWLAEGVGSGEALPEGETEEEGEPLPLPLGEALVEMLPVAVPGCGGKGGSPKKNGSMFITGASPAAPRLVGVLTTVRMAGRVGLEVFVAVRVEVRVRVEVPLPADPVASGLGREVEEARGEACPAALPVGEDVAVVTSWYSTDSTRVTVGTLTLM
jgi:hypothetical protein